MNDKKSLGILVGGFKAIGKSSLARKYNNIVDLESSNFEYIIDKDLRKIKVEQRKGLKNRVKNPNYPLNYYNEIISNLKKNKIVLFACKREIVNLLSHNNIDYYIVYPNKNMLNEIIDRCTKRGNNQNFISRIEEVYFEDFPKDNENVIWLENGEYLESVLIENGILDKYIINNKL